MQMSQFGLSLFRSIRIPAGARSADNVKDFPWVNFLTTFSTYPRHHMLENFDRRKSPHSTSI